MSMSSLKPSPLAPVHAGGTPPRASPFRRQNSSASNSSTSNDTNGGGNPYSSNTHNSNPTNNLSTAAPLPPLRATTPTNGGAPSTRPATPSKLQSASTPSQYAATFSPRQRGGGDSPTKHGSSSLRSNEAQRHVQQEQQQQRAQTFPSPSSATVYPATTRTSAADGLDALSSLPPQLVRSLRDAFSLLDRESTGTLTPADVTAMHAQLGLPPPTPTELSAYFPLGAPTPLALPAFLGGLAAPLARMDSSEELLAALGAFDERETGQVGVGELLDAVATNGGGGVERGRLRREEAEAVMKGFTGRPRFSRPPAMGMGPSGNPGAASSTGSGGDVFRYREWVGSLGLNGERTERDQVV